MLLWAINLIVNMFIVIVILSLKISLRGFDHNHYKFWKWNFENIILFFQIVFRWHGCQAVEQNQFSILTIWIISIVYSVVKRIFCLLILLNMEARFAIFTFVYYTSFIVHLKTGSQQPMMHFASIMKSY